MTRGLVFSGQLLLDLAAAGMLREQAYGVVQAHAMRAWEEESDFRAAIEADPEIRAVLKPEQIAEAFSLERQLRNVDQIFARVFGEQEAPVCGLRAASQNLPKVSSGNIRWASTVSADDGSSSN